jgi:hypothetical protein
VSIDSPTPQQTIAELLAAAERHDPYVDVSGRG